jgi:hypothetical protein
VAAAPMEVAWCYNCGGCGHAGGACTAPPPDAAAARRLSVLEARAWAVWAVVAGRWPGLYARAVEAEVQCRRHPGARSKRFETVGEAAAWLRLHGVAPAWPAEHVAGEPAGAGVAGAGAAVGGAAGGSDDESDE